MASQTILKALVAIFVASLLALTGCGNHSPAPTPAPAPPAPPACPSPFVKNTTAKPCLFGYEWMWDNDTCSAYCGHVPLGCGVAIASSGWPNPGAGDFDLQTMMKNAQEVLGPHALPLWRYDWEAWQSVANGSWTYVATDWCADANNNTHNTELHYGKHPTPNGSSPGLLGWNEPNVPGQCEAAPQGHELKAVEEFVALARDFKTHGKFVVTPAPGGGARWLDNFLSACATLNFTDIDFMAYHNYVRCDSGTVGNPPPPFTTPKMMYTELQSELTEHITVMEKYNKQGFAIRGIWLTEVACAPDGGWGHGTWRMDAPDILMTQLNDLVRYNSQLLAWNWFPYRQFGMLWDDTNYSITALGKKYFSNCQRARFETPAAAMSTSEEPYHV